MQLTDIPLLNVLRTRMAWLSERQNVISQNVASANAPGYKVQDLREPTFEEMLAGQGTNKKSTGATHAKHFDVAGADSMNFEKAQTKGLGGGTSVVLEEEMMKISEIQMEYQSVTGLYRKSLDLMRMALRSGR